METDMALAGALYFPQLCYQGHTAAILVVEILGVAEIIS